MKNIVISMQNTLLSEAVARTLAETREFRVEQILPGHADDTLSLCETVRADILLMEVSRLNAYTLERDVYKRQLPCCTLFSPWSAACFTVSLPCLLYTSLPKTFAELEALAEKAKAAGVRLCISQIQYPGSGFQYLCYIAQAGFLGTLEGIQWQKDYLTGKANISDTPGMMESMRYIQKWKDVGMLDCSGSDASSDHRTREEFIKGNTLFMLGHQNGITESLGTEDEFGLMPYISEDGSQNVFILNVNRYFGVKKKLEKNPEKLEDALKIMRVLSTVEGMSSLHADTTLKSNLLPLKEAKADAAYFKDIAAVIDAGNTATMIYNGWENTCLLYTSSQSHADIFLAAF